MVQHPAALLDRTFAALADPSRRELIPAGGPALDAEP
jgi:hypothetical protein